MADPTEDTAVSDFLDVLEEHRKNCERQGKYVEAEIAKNRLEELKLHEENRRRVSFDHFLFCKTLKFLTFFPTSKYCRRRCVHVKLLSAWA
jgi:hypothetical protein